MRKLLPLSLILSVVFSAGVMASDDKRPEHFKGEPSENLQQAVANLSAYNQKLAAIIDKSELSLEDMAEIHQLTYTLENALQRMDKELDNIAETLEEVHIGSEHAAFDKVKKQGQEYLEKSSLLVK
jgi:vacuolar-type H+-ATPase subunit I/STV1